MPSIKENKRRLLILHSAGHTEVPLDGSWGPYQANLWDRYTKLTPWYGKLLDKAVSTIKSVEPLNRLFSIIGESNDKVRLSSALMKPINLVNSGFRIITSPISVAFSYAPDKILLVMSYLDPTRITNLFNSELYTNPDFRYNENKSGPQPVLDIIEVASWLVPTKHAKNIKEMSSELKNAKLINDAWYKSRDNLIKGVGNTVVEYVGLKTREFNDMLAFLNRPNPPYIYGGHIKLKKSEMLPDWNSTIEVHLTPKGFFDENGNLESWTNDKSVSLSSARMLNQLSDNSAISVDFNALTLGQYLDKLPTWKRDLHLLTGHKPNPETHIVDGFSTDVIPLMLASLKKGRGEIVPSVNSYMLHLNGLGNSTGEFGKYFNGWKIREDGRPLFEFESMTPKQVLKWNWDYPLFKIDFFKRRMRTPIFIKRNGKKKG